MSQLFLSHSSRNNAEAVALRDWLARQGWDDVFLDIDPNAGIAPGERWERALNRAANRCEAVLFLVSRAWLASGWCLKEFDLAHKLSKRMFGVLIEDIPVADLPVNLTATWQIVNLATGRDHEMLKATLPFTQEEVHVTFSAEGLKRLRAGLRQAGLDPTAFAWPPASDPDRSPYPGLRPLEAQDAGIFFGREAPTIEALDRLRALREGAGPRLLCVLGASGSGKSSFLRAGLWPRLARDDRHFLPLPVLRPERAAISGKTGLLACLNEACRAGALPVSRADLRDAVAGGAETLRPILARLVGAAAGSVVGEAGGEAASERPALPLLVLSIDQGEELFRAEGRDEATALLALLRDLMAEDAPAVCVLMAIRSDAVERLQLASALEGIALQTMVFSPMPRGVYASIVEGPAARAREAGRKLAIDPALTRALLADLDEGGGTDALPLLAFTLERLWFDYHGAGRLSLADYDALGRVRGSIEAAVEQALVTDATALPHDRTARLALMRRGLVPWLAGIDPETDQPRRRVARRSEIPEETRPLIDLLIESRLLSADTDPSTGEATVEPAHEALLRQWGQLAGWLQEDKSALVALAGVQRAAKDWDQHGRGSGWLTHAGDRLTEAEVLTGRPDLAAQLGPAERDYLAACRARAAREAAEARARIRLRRIGQWGSLAAAIVFAVLGALAWAQRREAVASRQEALLQRQEAVLQRETADREARNAKERTIEAEREKQEADRQRGIAERQTEMAGTSEREAQKQREAAERNFGIAKTTIDQVIFDLTQGLRQIEGIRISVLKTVLSRVETAMDQLILAAPDDLALHRSRAVMLNEFGDTYVAAGDRPAAMKAYQEGLAIRRNLAQRDPDNTGWQIDLSGNLNRIGNLNLDAGDVPGALAAYREALTIARKLAQRDPNNIEWQRDLVLLLNNIGTGKLRTDDAPGALEAYEEALTLARNLAQRDPDDIALQRYLSGILQSVGDLKVQTGDDPGALAAYQEGMIIARAMAQRDPDNTEWQDNLAKSLTNIADFELQTPDVPGALVAYQEGLTIRRNLVRRDPDNAVWQSSLAYILDRIGDAKLQTGDAPGALAAKQEGLTIRRTLAQRDPNSTDARRSLATSLDKIGDFKLRTGDASGALAAYEEGLDIARAMALGNPLDTEWQRAIYVNLNKIGYLKIRTGDALGAVAARQESLDIIRALVRRDPDTIQWPTDLVMTLHKLAGATPDNARKRTYLEEALAILLRLEGAGRLPSDQKAWPEEIRAELARL